MSTDPMTPIYAALINDFKLDPTLPTQGLEQHINFVRSTLIETLLTDTYGVSFVRENVDVGELDLASSFNGGQIRIEKTLIPETIESLITAAQCGSIVVNPLLVFRRPNGTLRTDDGVNRATVTRFLAGGRPRKVLVYRLTCSDDQARLIACTINNKVNGVRLTAGETRKHLSFRIRHVLDTVPVKAQRDEQYKQLACWFSMSTDNVKRIVNVVEAEMSWEQSGVFASGVLSQNVVEIVNKVQNPALEAVIVEAAVKASFDGHKVSPSDVQQTVNNIVDLGTQATPDTVSQVLKDVNFFAPKTVTINTATGPVVKVVNKKTIADKWLQQLSNLYHTTFASDQLDGEVSKLPPMFEEQTVASLTIDIGRLRSLHKFLGKTLPLAEAALTKKTAS